MLGILPLQTMEKFFVWIQLEESNTIQGWQIMDLGEAFASIISFGGEKALSSYESYFTYVAPQLVYHAYNKS